MNSVVLAAEKEIDFMIHGVFSYELFGQKLWITTTHISVVIVMISLIIIALIVNRAVKRAAEVPEGVQNIAELAVEMLGKMVDSSMGPSAWRFVNYISTLFVFILFCNLSGLLGLRPPTADYGVTLPLALITFLLIHINSIRFKGIGGYLKSYLDPFVIWAPINLIGNIAVPVSMSLRLFANILTGLAMMSMIYGLLGWVATGWPAFLHIYFDIFSGAIQTYVFCMLTMTYVSDSVNG